MILTTSFIPSLCSPPTLILSIYFLSNNRKPKENNFKAILETIRDLMNTKTVVPDWLHDIFLGYGDPTVPSAPQIPTLDFVDTFLDVDHLVNSFPNRYSNFVLNTRLIV